MSVPGVAEGLPSVIVGDCVILSDVTMPDDSPQYQGYVHEVHRESETLLLRFQAAFHESYSREDYNVRFLPNRCV